MVNIKALVFGVLLAFVGVITALPTTDNITVSEFGDLEFSTKFACLSTNHGPLKSSSAKTSTR
jgi:hypothetical protein